MKKIYAVADVVPEKYKYLIAGKEYEIIAEHENISCFADESNCLYHLRFNQPKHDGIVWRRVEREE